MNGKFLLDTNIIIALFAQDVLIQEHLAKAQATFVSIITVGELYYGAEKSKHINANTQRIDEFVDQHTVLPNNVTTAKHYGQIKHVLRKKGHPIPDNDIWIAAIAQQYQLTLVSRDKHFNAIEGLSLVRW